jgi:hypothetical protein
MASQIDMSTRARHTTDMATDIDHQANADHVDGTRPHGNRHVQMLGDALDSP